jgi:DNA-binding transcriptional ArsR family regulator
MNDGPNIATIAALVGDPARANMLTALMDGRALTASELANQAGVAPSTASSHLGKLEAAGLLSTDKQGRHRYFRLSGSDVASVLEGLMGLAARTGQVPVRTGPKDLALRNARVCYDHLAGEHGVRMLDSLQAKGFIVGNGGALSVTDSGQRFLRRCGIELDRLGGTRRPLCRACLDWSERRSHLGGALGAAILLQLYKCGWVTRESGSRALLFSQKGSKAFDRLFAA